MKLAQLVSIMHEQVTASSLLYAHRLGLFGWSRVDTEVDCELYDLPSRSQSDGIDLILAVRSSDESSYTYNEAVDGHDVIGNEITESFRWVILHDRFELELCHHVFKVPAVVVDLAMDLAVLAL
jgi:hypothetical protein